MTRNAFEEQLARRLGALADRAPAEPRHIPQPLHGRASRPRRWPLVVAAAAVTVAAGAAVVSIVDRDDSAEVVTGEQTVPEASDPVGVDIVTVEQLPQPVELSILSVRPNNLSLAVADLRTRSTSVHPPGTTALGPDAASGAAITPQGDIAVWEEATVYVFPAGDLSTDPIELSPGRIERVSGAAIELFVQPSPDGEQLWIVQPGFCCGVVTPTIIDRVDVATAEVLRSIEIPEQGFPMGESNQGLVLNVTGEYVETTDGFVSDPRADAMLIATATGTVEEIGPGRAIAVWQNYVVYQHQDPNELIIRNLSDDNERRVQVDESGTWSGVGGPIIPSTAQPLPGVSEDGRLLVALVDPGRDESGEATNSSLYAVELRSGQATKLASFNGNAPIATWSQDAEWVLMLWGRDVRLLNIASGRTIGLINAVPDNHFVLGVG